MENKKSLLKNKKALIIIGILIITVAVIGATIAYFQTQFSVTEEIKTADFSYRAVNKFQAPSTWVPGDSVTPTLTVTNTGNTTIGIRARINETWISGNSTTLSNTLDNNEDVGLKTIGTNWTKIGNYYYYNQELEPNATTSSLITSLTFNTNVGENISCEPINETQSRCDSNSGYGNSTYTITVDYEILQSNAVTSEWNVTIANNIVTALPNPYIKAAYTYDEETCQTGNESGCVATTCYKSGTCPVGTIIDYQVDSSTTNNTNANNVTSGIMRFHVLSDDGTTMTLQSQRNVVKGVAWYSASNSNSSGPTTILASLESATSGWSNVNTLAYNLSDSGTNALGYTLCSSYNSCTSNAYTMSKSNVKARLITMQEATSSSIGGCTTSAGSCKKFMSNYLYNHSTYNNTYYDSSNGNYGYWTSSAINSDHAWFVYYYGSVTDVGTTNTNRGARAVVQVNKQ